MKTLGRRSAQFLASAVMVTGVSFAVPSHAQSVPQDVADAAQTACKDSAVAKGFEVASIASVESKPGTTNGVNVILNLTKNGEPFKLTCGYTPAATAATSAPASPAAIASPSPVTTNTDPVTTAPVTTEKGGFPWWILIPLLGIPLLFWLFRGSRKEEVVTRPTEVKTYTPPAPARELEPATRTTTDFKNYVTPSQAYIRGNGRSVDVYSGPATTYRVTGSLRDGDSVILSGRRENHWVELTDGGWVTDSSVHIA
jgi:hypothetical protein